MTFSSAPGPHARITCIICAYDEGPRIGAVLSVAAQHPLVDEVIVVDDGSRDDTADVVRRFANVRLISHPTNRGKSQAVATGVAAARHDLLMLLDADLKGLRAEDVSALALPVLTGRAGASMSLRRNSLLVFRAIGIDFVSGERVVGKALLSEVLHDIRALPRFGIEVFMNKRIIAARLPVAIADWTQVTQSRKTEKLGWWRGVRAEWRMVFDLMDAVYPIELLSQTLRLAALRLPVEDEAALAGRRAFER
jgi:glycosyltransferase involved in cell wall biosynthesis